MKSIHEKRTVRIIIPMAGAGSRFASAGYDKPKPFIDVLGKPMIFHVLENLHVSNSEYILLVRSEHLNKEKVVIDEIVSQFNVTIVPVDSLTEGAACTVLHAHKLINDCQPILIANSDQIVDINVQDFIHDSDARDLDGSILCFEDTDAKWSYAKLDETGLVTLVKEKEVISSHATVGLYYFRYGKIFVENAIDMIVRNERVNKEFYVAPVYNYAIKNGSKIGIYSIDKISMHGTGTPADLNAYIEFASQQKDGK